LGLSNFSKAKVCGGLLTWHKALARMGMKKLEVPRVRMKKQEVFSLVKMKKRKASIAFWNCVGGKLLLVFGLLN
jgi:hypothetical protein